MSAPYFDTSEKLADILGFTGPRRVQQLTKEGVLVREATGQYNIPDNVERYFRKKLVGAATVDFETERALHEKAKRELAEINLAKTKGEIHMAGDVEMVWTGMLMNFRSRIIGMPSKLAPQIVGMETIAEISGVLEAVTSEALAELSEYDPAQFSEVSNATDNSEPAEAGAEKSGGAAAQADSEPVGGPAPAAKPGKLSRTGPVADKPRPVSKGNHGRGKRPAGGKGRRSGKQSGREK